MAALARANWPGQACEPVELPNNGPSMNRMSDAHS